MKIRNPAAIKLNYSEMAPEERIAWRFLIRMLLDCTKGPRERRVRSFAEVKEWMADEEAEWSFERFCAIIEVKEEYFKRKFCEYVRAKN